MISTMYIHEYDVHDQFLYESYYAQKDIEDLEQKLYNLDYAITERKMFGESVDDLLLYTEAEKKNIFTKIGEALINVFQAFIDFLVGVKNDIKKSFTSIRKKGSNTEIVEAMESNPELANEFLRAIANGNIKMRDIKDINELIETATKLSNDFADGKLDKKSFGDKINNALDKFGNAAKNIGAIIGVASASIGIASAIQNINNNRESEYRAQNADRRAENKEGRDAEKHNWDRDKHKWDSDAHDPDLLKILADREKDKHDWARDEHNARMAKFNASNSNNSNKNGTYVKNSYMDDITGDYYTESVNSAEFIKKVTDWISNMYDHCGDLIDKVKGSSESIVSKLKAKNTTEDTDKASTIAAAFRRVLSAITKDMNTAKNVAEKAEKAMP